MKVNLKVPQGWSWGNGSAPGSSDVFIRKVHTTQEEIDRLWHPVWLDRQPISDKSWVPDVLVELGPGKTWAPAEWVEPIYNVCCPECQSPFDLDEDYICESCRNSLPIRA
jgi:hypothetical protein